MTKFYVAVHTIITNNEGKLLITKRAEDNDYMPLKWDIPGGTIEEGETVREALIREVMEETNLNISPVRPIYVYSNLSQLPTRQTIQIVYYSRYDSGIIKLNPEEHEEYKWISWTEVDNYDCMDFVKKMIEEIHLDFNTYRR